MDDKVNPVDAKADANTASIATLNTKQIHNFSLIQDIQTDLTTNYQTNTQLTSNYSDKVYIDTNYNNNTQLTTDYYTKAEIDTTLGNYYNSTVIDNGFYTQTQINTN